MPRTISPEGRVQVYEAAFAIVRPQLESGKISCLP